MANYVSTVGVRTWQSLITERPFSIEIHRVSSKKALMCIEAVYRRVLWALGRSLSGAVTFYTGTQSNLCELNALAIRPPYHHAIFIYHNNNNKQAFIKRYYK